MPESAIRRVFFLFLRTFPVGETTVIFQSLTFVQNMKFGLWARQFTDFLVCFVVCWIVGALAVAFWRVFGRQILVLHFAPENRCQNVSMWLGQLAALTGDGGFRDG